MKDIPREQNLNNNIIFFFNYPSSVEALLSCSFVRFSPSLPCKPMFWHLVHSLFYGHFSEPGGRKAMCSPGLCADSDSEHQPSTQHLVDRFPGTMSMAYSDTLRLDDKMQRMVTLECWEDLSNQPSEKEDEREPPVELMTMLKTNFQLLA